MKKLCFATVGWLLLMVASAAAQSFDGTWDGSTTMNGQHITYDCVMQGNRYSETARMGDLMTKQSGTYVVDGDTLIRSVEDWEPKRVWVTDQNSYEPRPNGHWENTAKPPGGSWKVKWVDADTMVWKDVSMGGVVRYERR